MTYISVVPKHERIKELKKAAVVKKEEIAKEYLCCRWRNHQGGPLVIQFCSCRDDEDAAMEQRALGMMKGSAAKKLENLKIERPRKMKMWLLVLSRMRGREREMQKRAREREREREQGRERE